MKHYYHASRNSKFKSGDVITPNKGAVFLTQNKYRPHPTLFMMPKGKNIGETRYTIYQVKPTGMVKKGVWGDFITFNPVIIIRKICNAPSKKGKYDYTYRYTFLPPPPEVNVNLKKKPGLMSNRKRKRQKHKR